MRRINKPAHSIVLQESLSYKVSRDNSKLAKALRDEQNNICAYTETYLGRSDKKDIEHFNPTLKGTEADNYQNWFLVKAQWNSEKATKWVAFQPILHPTADDFEQRIIYLDGEYIETSANDEEASHLIKLLKLDDPELAIERLSYLENIRETLEFSGKTPQQYIDDLLRTRPNLVYFIRALEEELAVTVNFNLAKTK
jgi:uncharacterized protein (TIGR02646 family)